MKEGGLIPCRYGAWLFQFSLQINTTCALRGLFKKYGYILQKGVGRKISCHYYYGSFIYHDMEERAQTLSKLPWFTSKLCYLADV